ncbi:MAG: hypothetical protein AVDCRST_MAG64-1185 [uncultured Phycisphaerae bacterium]|uniref:Uncharacterized protein n=1 Tax=uncultured Phycisphaerae bacterium TaxID=904963 RepID=A0A6J4NL69_9BACT|nr:MAG: hypothetical protein AVDCRST_MAG64-1185 [uncultured Phycisphaerae bacterium]
MRHISRPVLSVLAMVLAVMTASAQEAAKDGATAAPAPQNIEEPPAADVILVGQPVVRLVSIGWTTSLGRRCRAGAIPLRNLSTARC